MAESPQAPGAIADSRDDSDTDSGRGASRLLSGAAQGPRRAVWRIRNGRATPTEALVFGLVALAVVLIVGTATALTVARVGGAAGAAVSTVLWLGAILLIVAPPRPVRRLTELRVSAAPVVLGQSPAWAARAGGLARAQQVLVTRDDSRAPRPTSILPPPSGVPSVAVIVAAFSEEKYVEQCLRSLQWQSLEDWECIVVDDDSRDRTPGIVARLAAEDPRIRLFRHSRNRGLATARNTGLSLVRAPLVTFLDADDVLTSDSLTDRVSAFLRWEAPDLAGTFCGLRQVAETIDHDALPPSYDWTHERPMFVDLASCGGVNPFGVHQPLIRTEVARAVGGFDESFRFGAEDYDFWMRVMRSGYHFRPSYRLTALYRQKAGSMVRDLIVDHYDSCRRILRALDEPQELNRQSASAPWPINEPLGALERKLVLAERAVRSAGLAIGVDKPERALALLERVEPHVAELALRHVDIAWSLNAGLRRAWGVSEFPADNSLRPQLRGLHNIVRDMLVGRAAPLREGPVEIRESREVDWLLCPTNAAHARSMVDAARAAGGQAMFLTLEEMDDQGAAAVVASSGVDHARLLDLVGENVGFRCLVVSEPVSHSIRGLVRAVQRRGGRVVALDGPALLPPLDDAGASLRGLVTDRVTATDFSGALTSPLIRAADLDVVAERPDSETLPVLLAEESRTRRFDAAAIEKLKDSFKGERCVIIGNGPSLNQMDLSRFANVPTFAVNGIFYASDRMGFDPTFYVVEDSAVMADNTDRIRDFRAQYKLFPSIYRPTVGEASNLMYFRMNRGFYDSRSPHYCVPRFSTDASNRVYCGQSVSIINLQLAYYFGFSEVVLIGMDFSYTVPDTVERQGDVFTSTEADPNHFHPDYFGPGKKWKDPKLDRVLSNYELAKRMYAADDRRIVNGTVGGQLEVFPRVSHEELFR